jgi:hypothetical protein
MAEVGPGADAGAFDENARRAKADWVQLDQKEMNWEELERNWQRCRAAVTR